MIPAQDRPHGGLKDWLLSRTGLATLVVVAVLGFLIYTGHSAHLLGALPYLLILSRPLMHIFLHGAPHHHLHDNQHDHERGGSDGPRDG